METYEAQAVAEAIQTIREYNAWHLSSRAECGEPDNREESAGARFLLSVRDGVVEILENATDEDGTVDEVDDFDTLDDDGALHEVADNAPDVYNTTRWAEFHDLAAWQESPADEWGADALEGKDMTDLAGICLFMIADRLVRALVDEVRTAMDEAEEPDEGDEVSP